jgi:energy-coupling factor transporter ATP-binding protein EcfA2
MNSSPIFSFFKKNKNVIDDVTSISSLAPKVLTLDNDLAKVQPYLDKLKDTLNAKGINNIALTGGYGSGKSTLLKTFQHLHKNDFKFLNISLAAFNQTKTKDNFKDIYEIKIKNGKTEKEAEREIVKEFKETIISNNEVEKHLEISILQQIIYKVKPSNLPESRFKRIVNIPSWKLWGLIPFSFVLWLSSLILLFKYDYLNNINPNTWIYKNNVDWSTVCIFLISFLGIGYFSKLVVELFSNSKINKVNLKGEIEIGDDSSKSILNEHYDEILYYFEKNDFNVVVIEDLDRFDNTNIFTKLRELNILLNNADTIRNKPAYKNFGIKFLYAVGDDLFNDKKERVKFFEYIIPVIPFINSSNANDQLKTLIKDSDLEENVFPKEFISDITTFIDDIDMRLLINIFHEFVIYRNILKPDVLDGREAELFAMITYKNIDPEDFNKLNCKEGKLYKLINNKRTYVQKLISTISAKIIVNETEIENIKAENISDLEELKPIYLIKISEKIDNATDLYINNRRLRFSDLMPDDIFNLIINSTSFKYYQNGNGTYTSNVSFKDVEDEVNPDLTYKQRVELIENKHSNRITLLQREIENLRHEKSEIQNWDLKQIFKEVDINQYLIDFSNNGLLRNLILEGYISENYNDYISLFHEVSLTREDKKFERNVKSGINEGFEYKLTHIDNLITNHIDLKYFERETILNFDLLDCMGNNYIEYSKQYDLIINLLSNEKEKSIEFIDIYVSDEARPLTIFIEKLVKNWKGFWAYIYCNNYYSPEKVDTYLRLIIQFSDVLTIINNQNNQLIKEAIEKKPHFLSLIKESDELFYFAKIANIFELLNVKFDKLDNPTEENTEIFDFVYNNSNYEINIGNLMQMLEIYSENKDLFETSNYSTILNSNCQPLIEYVNSQINTYVKNVYLKLEKNKFEEEESLINLLNHKELDFKLKSDIIEKVETKISDISNIKSRTLKSVLLDENKVAPKWSNVVKYYTDCDKTIDEKLIHFLNFEDAYNQLSNEKMIFESESFDYPSFRENLLLCNELSYHSYSNILKKSIYTREILLFENLDEDKVDYLTKSILNITKSNYDLLREHFPNNHIELIEKDFNKFLEKIDDFETDEDDVLLILKSEKISIDNKFKYVALLDNKNILDNKEISKLVGNIILQKSTKIEFEYGIVESLVKNVSSSESKVNLVNLYIDDLDNTNAVSLLKNIWGYDKLFEKGRPTYVKSDYNDILFKKLKSKNLIKKFYDDSWSSSKFRVTTNY